VHIFNEMKESGLSPNEYTYSSILNAITGLENLQEGQQVHAQLKVILIQFKPFQYLQFIDKVWRTGSLSNSCDKFTHYHVCKVY
jgi:PPR repeat family